MLEFTWEMTMEQTIITDASFLLVVSFWTLAGVLVLLRFAFPKAQLTGKFIEYLANVSVSPKN
jgi:hypothetical protein